MLIFYVLICIMIIGIIYVYHRKELDKEKDTDNETTENYINHEIEYEESLKQKLNEHYDEIDKMYLNSNDANQQIDRLNLYLMNGNNKNINKEIKVHDIYKYIINK